jgi:hypothetical protein
MTAPILTLFTTPKAFVGPTAVQQRNALKSWLCLGDQVQVLAIGNDPGVEAAANDLGIEHIPTVERDELGTPRVDSVFRQGISATESRLLCYANADIILMSEFLDAVRAAASSRFLMCGRRWDVDLEAPIDFSEIAWERELRKRVAKSGILHAATGMDYFVFPRGLFRSVPPFSIGRAQWDNWLLFQARGLGARVVDATAAVMAVHQNHGYQHVEGGIAAVWSGPSALNNRSLSADMLMPFTIDDATYRLTSGGLSRNFSPKHVARLPAVWAALSLRNHPRLLAVLRTAARPLLAGRT